MQKLLLYNARVYTVRSTHDPGAAGALLLAGDRVVAADDAAGLESLLGPGDLRCDLGGRTVVPGFIDAHVHLSGFSLNLADVDLAGAPDLDTALARVAAAAADLPPGAWVQGWGLAPTAWGRWPTRADLDAASPHRPVALNTKDGHTLCVNTLALRLAGVDALTPDPPGGHIVRDGAGAPAGLLQENAQDLVWRVVPPRTLEETVRALRRGIRHAHTRGVAGVHNVDGTDSFRALQALHRAGELGLRVVEYLEEGAIAAAAGAGLESGFGDDWLRIGGIKMFSDGSLGSQTAWMLAHFNDRPDWVGVPTHTPAEMADLVGRCVAHNLACAIHAIGDAANRMVLDAFAAHAEDSGRRGLRHRIEHAQHLHPRDLPRFAQLGVTASVQPSHCPSDRDTADRSLGPERCRHTYAFQSLLGSGAHLACGSDVPVEPMDPVAGLHAAVFRRRPGRDEAPWYPAEALTPYQALYSFTRGAAYAGGTNARQGSLEPGMLADVTVLSHDVLSGREEDLLACRVEATLVGGAVVYGDLPVRPA